MKQRAYSEGLTVLGGEVVGSASPNWAVHVRIRNLPELLKKQVGGFGGGIAAGLAPATVDALIYTRDSAGAVSSAVGFAPATIAGRIKEQLTKQGIESEVDVVSPAPGNAPSILPGWKPFAVGFGLAGAIALAIKLVRRRK